MYIHQTIYLSILFIRDLFNISDTISYFVVIVHLIVSSTFFICSLFSTLGKTLLDFFSPRRPLKPKRKVRHRPKPQNVHVSTCDVTVRVVRAINVPIRGDEEEDCGLCQDWRGDWEEGKDKVEA